MRKVTSFIPALLGLFAVASAADLTHIPYKDFNTLRAARNQFPTGIWSDGTARWVADSANYFEKIYAYNMRNKARDQSNGVTSFCWSI